MNRLDFIASLTHGFDVVIDIGSDHGLVLKKAFDLKLIKKGIATDLNIGPLNASKKTLTGYPVEFYLSDGLKDVKSDFDLGIITGMGPYLINDIMKLAPKNKTYILGANEKIEVLRQALVENGFMIVDEHVIYDDFYYVFLIVTGGNMVLNEDELYLGPILKTKKGAKNYFIYKKDYYSGLIKKAKGLRKKEFEKLYTIYLNALNEVQFLK